MQCLTNKNMIDSTQWFKGRTFAKKSNFDFQSFFTDLKSQMPCDHRTERFFFLSFLVLEILPFKAKKDHQKNVLFFSLIIKIKS